MTPFDEAILDDADALASADTGEVLLALASSGALVRRAALACTEAGLRPVPSGDRPRAVVLATAPGCGPLLAALDAVTGPGAALPVWPATGRVLPGWAGPLDLLVVVGPQGDEPDLLALAEQAYRRGLGLVAITPAATPLASAAEQARGVCLPVPAPHPRTWFWPQLTALVATAHAYGVGGPEPTAAAEALADRLDAVGTRCSPAAETYTNPAKSLASALAGSVPVLWGTGPAAGVAARRFAENLGSGAGVPALSGVLPDAARTAGTLFDGGLGRGESAEDDFFRDRVDDAEPLRLRLVLLADSDEAAVRRTGDVVRAIVRDRGIPVDDVAVDLDAATPLEHLGALAALGDFTATYLALATGVDPGAPGPFTLLASGGGEPEAGS